MQQVNLYRAQLKPKRELFTLSNSALVCVAVLASLSAWWFLQWQSVSAEEAVLRHLEQKVALLKLDNTLANDRPPVTEKAELEAEIQELTQTLEQRQTMLEIIDRSRDRSSGFAANLEGIRKALPETVQLTSVSLADSGLRAHFTGDSAAGADIAKFLENLYAEPSFLNTDFGPLTITASGSRALFHIGREGAGNGKERTR